MALYLYLITFTAVFTYRFLDRHNKGLWSKKSRVSADGITYFEHTPYRRHWRAHTATAPTFIGISHGMHVPRFDIHRERGWDRFLKKTGLCHEFQTGYTEFDRKTFISCDDEAFCKNLKKAEMQQLITEFLDDYKATRIRSDGRNVWLVTNKKTIKHHAHELASKLKRFQMLAVTPNFTAKPKSLTPYIIMAVNMALVSLAIVSLAMNETNIVQGSKIFTHSFVAGTIAFSLWFLLVCQLTHKTSRSNVVILDTLLFGYAGFLVLAFIVLFRVNAVYDTSYPMNYSSQITGINRHARGGTRIYVRHWKNPGKTYTMTAGGGMLCHGSDIGSTVNISVKKGHLGYEWVSSESANGLTYNTIR